MVVVSKLKVALNAEQKKDFGKEFQKKMAKKARKEQKTKPKKVVEAEEEEDVEMEGEGEGGSSEDEDEEGLAELMEMEGELESGDERQINLAHIDDSDSASSSGVSDGNGLSDEEMSDEEDIPLSDLEDLDDEDKEDIIPHQRLTINNTAALTTALRRIALPLKNFQFVDHQSLTTAEPVIIADVGDDLTRELEFYKQSLSAVQEARKLLKAEKQPFSRPTDYFAEMVKADEHMARIKAKLIEAAAGKKASAEARKQRDLKKFGKQVQNAKLQERQKEKTALLDKVKVLKRKRQDGEVAAGATEADMFDVELENTVSKPDGKRSRDGDRSQKRNKRAAKDEKYGHGGKKRHAKSNDSESTGDLKGFSSRKMKGQTRTGGGSGAAKARPGKARRAGGRK